MSIAPAGLGGGGNPSRPVPDLSCRDVTVAGTAEFVTDSHTRRLECARYAHSYGRRCWLDRPARCPFEPSSRVPKGTWEEPTVPTASQLVTVAQETLDSAAYQSRPIPRKHLP